MAKATPTMEDYIEVIYSLVKNKGYARSADIAEKLDVYPSTVTKMLKKLDVEGYIVYEKYRGCSGNFQKSEYHFRYRKRIWRV